MIIITSVFFMLYLHTGIIDIFLLLWPPMKLSYVYQNNNGYVNDVNFVRNCKILFFSI